MANPGRTPFVQVSQEILLALRLFGRLNGTEWECVATVMAETWGDRRGYREEAHLGIADFRRASTKTIPAIARALCRLGEGNGRIPGFRVLRVVEPPTTTSSTTWGIQRDWEMWAWDSDEMLDDARARVRRRFKANESEVTISDDAIELARHLRDLASINNPGANLPAPGDSPQWRGWCEAMQSILDRDRRPESPTHTPAAVRVVLSHAFTDAFWSQRLRGPQAADRAAKDYDTLLAMAQTSRRRP